MKIEKLEETIKKEKIRERLILLVAILQLVLSIILIEQMGYMSFLRSNQVEYDLSELNSSEQEKVLFLLSDLKPIFLKNQKKIVFTKNVSFRYLHEGGSYETPSGLLGFNKNKGEIYVQYSEKIETMRLVLCHELLHTYVSGLYQEEIVSELEQYAPCYKSSLPYSNRIKTKLVS